MKEKLYTIPLNDAVNAGDECPFCYIERNVEQDLMDFVLGSCASYMESDVRENTDREGFCRTHMKKMFDYGNTLGNGWILKTYYKKLLSEMDGEFRHFRPQKQSMGDKLRKIAPKNSVADWVQKKESTCYICDRFQKEYERYLDTFFYLYEKETFFPEIFEIMQKNMERMSADVDWLIEKFDYQNKDADWKNSKDAIQRGMQNIRGGYPADPVYKMNK